MKKSVIFELLRAVLAAVAGVLGASTVSGCSLIPIMNF